MEALPIWNHGEICNIHFCNGVQYSDAKQHLTTLRMGYFDFEKEHWARHHIQSEDCMAHGCISLDRSLIWAAKSTH